MSTEEKSRAANPATTQDDYNKLHEDYTMKSALKARFSVITSEKPDHLTKIFTLENDELKKQSGGQMATGSVEISEADTIEHFADKLRELRSNQALVYGLPVGVEIGEHKKIVAENQLSNNPDAIARTLEYFKWSCGAGVMMFDHDATEGKALSQAELVRTLREAEPALKDVKMLWWPSSSSHICNKETGEDLTGLRGQRIYILVDDAAKIERIGKNIFRRLWLNGCGRIEIGAAGQLLEKSIVDASVWQANRLDFAAGALCRGQLEQRRGEPQIIPGSCGVLQTELVEDLTEEEVTAYQALANAAKAKKKPQADEIRAARIERLVAEHSDEDKDKLRAHYQQAYSNGELCGEYPVIVVENGQERTVTVSAILSNPESYHGLKTLDPIEPEYNGRHATGLLYLLSCKTPNLFSFAHGGKTYLLREKASEKRQAVKKELPLELISSLAKMTPIEYDQKRKEIADEYGIRTSTLDDAVKAERAKQAQSEEKGFSPEWLVDPWQDEVDGEELFNEIFHLIKKHVFADEESIVAASTWAVLTWLADAADLLPMAMITAPEPECGKSIFLKVIGKLVRRPLTTSGMSPAVLFRIVEAEKPTVLLDEVDAILNANEEFRGLLNAAHSRDSSKIFRMEEVNGKQVIKSFDVFGPKALSGIKIDTKHTTWTSRSIVIPLRKKTKSEKIIKFKRASQTAFSEVRSKILKWSQDHEEAFRKAVFEMPELPELENRDGDNWEPLLAVAQVAGEGWYNRVKHAAVKILGTSTYSPSIATDLLTDIKKIFETRKIEKISSTDLLAALCADDLARWQTFNKEAFPITPVQVANYLKPYGIAPHTVRLGAITKKGYELDDFSDVFKRYLPDAIGGVSQAVTPSQTCTDAGYSHFQTVTNQKNVTDKKEFSEASTADCYDVTGKNGGATETTQITEELF